MTSEMPNKTNLALSGVPETMLWPLWNRAAEQTRRDRLIDDPIAAELVARIDYDFAGMFGKPSVFHAIWARLLPEHGGAVSIRCSALDPAWMQAIPQTLAPFVSASGLLISQPSIQ